MNLLYDDYLTMFFNRSEMLYKDFDRLSEPIWKQESLQKIRINQRESQKSLIKWESLV